GRFPSARPDPFGVRVVGILYAGSWNCPRVEKRFVDVGTQSRGFVSTRVNLERLLAGQPIDEHTGRVRMRRPVGKSKQERRRNHAVLKVRQLEYLQQLEPFLLQWRNVVGAAGEADRVDPAREPVRQLAAVPAKRWFLIDIERFHEVGP